MQNTIQGKKIKILYVITKSNWGGAQRYVYDLATNLPKVKFDIAVALGGTGELGQKLTEVGIRVIQIQRLRRDIGVINDIATFFELVKIFLYEKPDVIHLNSSKVGGLGGLAGRIYNIFVFLFSALHVPRSTLYARIIFTAHGWAFNEERGVVSRFLIRCASWFTVALSHTTIVVSDYDRNQAERMLFLKHKIVRIHNGVRKIKFAAKNTAREILLPQHATSLGKALWVGTIAELHSNKGLSYAIKAVKKLKEKMGAEKFVFVIIGEGEERLALEKLIQEINLQNEVFLVGKKEGASSLLHAFDVFLLPSIKEGLPYVILEAGVAELPIVASAVGGIPEIIQDMKSGILVKSKHEDEIALALEFLLANPQKRAEFGETLKEYVVSNFSLERMAEEISRLYELNDNKTNTR